MRNQPLAYISKESLGSPCSDQGKNTHQHITSVLVPFDQCDEIEISPRNQPRSLTNGELAQSIRNRQMQKIKINHMLSSMKRSQNSISSRKLGRESLGMLTDDVPPLLEQQLNNIAQQTVEHREVEKFLLLFARNPDLAIQTWIDKGEIKNQPRSIARYLVQRKAINKVALGEYFSKNKEQVLMVLKEYCRCLGFQNLEFDKAMRCLLSKFKLPGEAQQIERILQVFSEVYYETHSHEFSNAGQIHILSYSLIMLSTDAHNPNQERKMTKAEFVRNTQPVCPRIPPQYLECMYDRIVKEQFQTQNNYIQKIYGRLHMLNLGVSVACIPKQMRSAVELMEGHVFLKYCKSRQKAVPRKVFLDREETMLQWIDPNEPNQKPRFIYLNQIVDLVLGCSSEVMKFNKVQREFDSMCFSIVTKSRTLDLNARNPDSRARWVNYLGAVLIERRENLRKKRQEMFKEYFNKDKIEQIWNTDIFPNWDAHWDYRLKRPKEKKYQTMLKALRRFFCCQDSRDQVYEVQSAEYDGMLPNKTPLLQTLWKYGLPTHSRKTLWPIVIGNALGITPSLYDMYCKRKRQIPQIHKLPYSTTAINLVQVLAVIRPDISLVRNLLELAEVFTRYLQQYDAFVAFANMMHSYYFLAFFQGNLVEIDFRLKFFDYLVEKNLRLVAAHFKALQINSKLFFVNWFLSLFSSCFAEQEFLARIWDNFFLQGEIYLFKVGVALIKYYEFQLKMSTFQEAIKLLTHPKATSEVYFFELLEHEIEVRQDEFDDYIQKRKFAVIKTKVQEIPLQ